MSDDRPMTFQLDRAQSVEAMRVILAKYPGATAFRVAAIGTLLRAQKIPPAPEVAASLRALADVIDSPIGDPVQRQH
jgi:hypothetical protein